MKNIALLLTGALLTWNISVFAADAPQPTTPPVAPQVQKMFQKFDIDKDGKISREEFSVKHAKNFARLDTDKNDSLSLDEFKGSCKNERCTQMKTKKFSKLDKDSNGSVTKGEFVGVLKVFDLRDRNKDGYLSEDEFPSRRLNRMDKAEPGMKKEAAPSTDAEMPKTPAK